MNPTPIEPKHRFVLGFVFDFEAKKVLLVLKNRPDWQTGLLNGLGGKIEADETPLEAMEREFKEETYFSSMYHGSTDRFEKIEWVPVGYRFRTAIYEEHDSSYEMFVFASFFSDVRSLDFEMPSSFRLPNTSTIWDVPAVPDPNREQVIALPLNREILSLRGVPGLAWTVDASLQALREGFYFEVEDKQK
jgi:hypothetical protein